MKGHGSIVWSPKRTTLLVVVIAEKTGESGEKLISHIQGCFFDLPPGFINSDKFRITC